MFLINGDIAKNIQNQHITTKDLALEKSVHEGRTLWVLKKYSEVAGGQEIITGKDLEVLFKKAANNESLPEGLDASFREFSKLIPGKSKFDGLIARIKDSLHHILRGSTTLKSLGKPFRIIDLDYALHEVVLRDSPTHAIESGKLIELWKASEPQISFKQWLKERTEEWKSANSQDTLATWLSKQAWDAKEQVSFQKEHPGPFSQNTFDQWKLGQIDPDYPIFGPKWVLVDKWQETTSFTVKKNEEEFSKLTKRAPQFDQWVKDGDDLQQKNGEVLQQLFTLKNDQLVQEGKPPLDYDTWVKEERRLVFNFQDWMQQELQVRISWWKAEHGTTEGIPLFNPDNPNELKKIDEKLIDYERLSPSLPMPIWIARELWKESHPSDLSDQAFQAHIEQQQYQYAKQKGTDPFPTFNEWKGQRDQTLLSRWEPAKAHLSFDEWKLQQINQSIIPRSFVRLDDNQRKGYLTQCEGGILKKGDTPFTSEHESTAHSGLGHVIFVIGPDLNLYTASHIRDVFHHSSFFGDGAVMSAGEIKTDNNGKIIALSGKSGHYKPSQKENIAMLEWFEKRGVNLAELDFTYFEKASQGWKTMNAELYRTGSY